MRSPAATEIVRRGIGHATGLYPATLLLFLIEAVDLSAGMLALVSLVASVLRLTPPIAFAGLFAVTTLWLIVQLLRPLIVAAALRQGTEFVRTGTLPSLPEALAREAGRGGAFFAYSLYVGSLIGAFNVLAMGSMVFAWFALADGSSAALGSLGLALATCVVLAFSFFGRLWLRMGLVRSVVSGEPILESLYDAVARLARRPLAPAGIILVLGFFSGVTEAAVAGAFTQLARGTLGGFAWGSALLLSFGAPIAASFIAAFVSAWFLHAQWQSLLVLELAEEGDFPAVEALPRALGEEEPIISALPVDEPASS